MKRCTIIHDILANIIINFCGNDPDDMLKEKFSSFATRSPGAAFSIIFDHRPVTLRDGSNAGRKLKGISDMKVSETNTVLLLDELLKTQPLTSVTDSIRTHNQRRHAIEMKISIQDHDTIPPDYNAPSLEFFGEDSRPSCYY